MNLRYLVTLLLLATICLASCQNERKVVTPSAYVTAPETLRARKTNDRGVALLRQGKLEQAEQAFKDALAADIAFGQAHNNLGRVYYEQGRLYLAAWEFQYAAKIMPSRPEPLNNLGLVYEAAGKWKEAIDTYRKALDLAPDDPEYVGNLARAKVRRGDNDDETSSLLQSIVEHDLRPEWVNWAKMMLVSNHSKE